MLGDKVGIQRSEDGLSVSFRARPVGYRATLAQLDWLSHVVPPVSGFAFFAVLAALHDGAGVGPGLAVRAGLTILLVFGLYTALQWFFTAMEKSPQIELRAHRGTLYADLDGRRIEAPLDQVRVNLANGMLTLSHPADTELIRPLQPQGVRPFVEQLAALQAAHGDRSAVPDALRERPV